MQLAQHVSDNYFAHLQEHSTVRYSLWYNAPNMWLVGGLEAEFLHFQTTGPPHTEYIIPQAVLHSLMLLKMGKAIARNMSS
jgi:hypothetical protein